MKKESNAKLKVSRGSTQNSGQEKKQNDYKSFYKIDGRHPFQDKVEGAYVNYSVRTRPNGKVLYFNFTLAKEMGLIPMNHPHELNKDLIKALLDTFALTIINEYDIIHKTPIDQKDIRPHQYMATRYLQLQHPSKKGTTSGDGRSMWNGHFQGRGKIWDISSSGTGATCLSPATAIENKYFKTGDPSVSYGCGCADTLDGIGAALMSEIFHKNGIKTERTLAIIEFDKNLSINVRAGLNLIRPSHFFGHLKQGNLERLKAITDYYIDREIMNGVYPPLPENSSEKYDYFLNRICEDFAKATARFERDYIFCWMGWDGDNILVDGGIIDYGSVRQFGLFHHKYRFDDVERFSTTIVEQKREARYIIQTFAQIIDYLNSGKKQNIKHYKNHEILEKFDQLFERYRQYYLLRQLGLNPEWINPILEYSPKLISNFERNFYYFERQTTIRGPIKVSDGISRNAIFSMRDILRELPQLLLKDFNPITAREFTEIIKSKFASKSSLKLTKSRERKVKGFQTLYQDIIGNLSVLIKKPVHQILAEITMRSSIINRFDRITGDSVVFLSDKILKDRGNLSVKEFHHILDEVIKNQVLAPEHQKALNKKREEKSLKLKERRLLEKMSSIIKKLREGL